MHEAVKKVFERISQSTKKDLLVALEYRLLSRDMLIKKNFIPRSLKLVQTLKRVFRRSFKIHPPDQIWLPDWSEMT